MGSKNNWNSFISKTETDSEKLKKKTKTDSWFSSVQSLSRVRLFATPWIAACQASLSLTNSRSSLRLMSIESVMPFSHLIFCRPLSSCPNPSQHQSLFQWVNSSHEVAKVLEFQLQHHSFQRNPRADLLLSTKIRVIFLNYLSRKNKNLCQYTGHLILVYRGF